MITVQGQVILPLNSPIFNSKLLFHFGNYLARDNTALEMSGEGLFDMSMKNVKPSPLWELIQIHALGKRNTQSDKKLKKCYKCEHELCNSENMSEALVERSCTNTICVTSHPLMQAI